MKVATVKSDYLDKLDLYTKTSKVAIITKELDGLFRNSIKTPDDVYRANNLLLRYKTLTGNEYIIEKENTIV